MLTVHSASPMAVGHTVGQLYADGTTDLNVKVGDREWIRYKIPLHAREIMYRLDQRAGLLPVGLEPRLTNSQVSFLRFQVPLFEFSTPGTKTEAPINEWNAPTDVRPTVGGTEPSQLFCSWDPDHHHRAQQALKRAEAAIPKLVPELSQDVHKGKFDDIL